MNRGPRWAHRLWAGLIGYFWLPCPSCGRYFGGHERPGPRMPVSDQLTCGRCEPTIDVEQLGFHLRDFHGWRQEDRIKHLGGAHGIASAIGSRERHTTEHIGAHVPLGAMLPTE